MSVRAWTIGFGALLASCTGSQRPDTIGTPRTTTPIDTHITVETGTQITGETAETADTAGSTVDWPAPNVMVLFIDDLGWTALAADRASLGNGSDYHLTPRMDELSDDGVTFTAAYAGNNSPPGRAGFFSGMYQTRTKVYTSGDVNKADPLLRLLDGAPETRMDMKGNVITIVELLDDAGYRTAHLGKWDIGIDGNGTGPSDQGFDENFGGNGTAHLSVTGHFARQDGSFTIPELPPNGIPEQFLADRLTDDALAFVEADPTQPWFVNLAHMSVHFPIQAPQEDIDVMSAVPQGSVHSDLTYAAMVYNVDKNIGRVMDYLEQTDDVRNPGHKIIENTLVILYSDNGGQGGYVPEGIVSELDVTNNFPLRHGKGALYEGGVRVPLVLRWDRGNQAGRVVDEQVTHVDFYGTIAELCDVPLDPGQPLDGISLVPVLDDATATLGRDYTYNHFPAYLDYPDAVVSFFRGEPTSVIWHENWKLTYWFEHRRWTLNDLATDIGEQHDVAAGNPDVVLDLGTALVDWLVDTGGDMPVEKGTQTDVALPDPQCHRRVPVMDVVSGNLYRWKVHALAAGTTGPRTSGCAHFAVVAAMLFGGSCGGDVDPGDGPTDTDLSPSERVLLSPAEHLIRASVALRGIRPTPDELATVSADPGQLPQLIDGYLDTPDFAAVVRDMHAELVLTRTDSDSQLPSMGRASQWSTSDIYGATSEEPLRLIEHIVTNDRPYTELVTADYMLANPVLADLYGLSLPTTDPGWQITRWVDGRPHAGLLSSSQIFRRHVSAGSNFHRLRANFLSEALLCESFADRDVVVEGGIDLTDEDVVANAVSQNPNCIACHQAMDPLAAALWGYKRQIDPRAVESAEDIGCWLAPDQEPPFSGFGRGRGQRLLLPAGHLHPHQRGDVGRLQPEGPRVLRSPRRRAPRPGPPDRRRPALRAVRHSPHVRLAHPDRAGRRAPADGHRVPGWVRGQWIQRQAAHPRDRAVTVVSGRRGRRRGGCRAADRSPRGLRRHHRAVHRLPLARCTRRPVLLPHLLGDGRPGREQQVRLSRHGRRHRRVPGHGAHPPRHPQPGHGHGSVRRRGRGVCRRA